MSRDQILIVEDEIDGLDVVTRLLNAKGVKAMPFDNAETAWERLNAEPERFRVAIIDLALPGIDGFELMQLIRGNSIFADVALIAITAYHTSELKVKALDSGFDAYFEKPLNHINFLKTVMGFAPIL